MPPGDRHERLPADVMAECLSAEVRAAQEALQSRLRVPNLLFNRKNKMEAAFRKMAA